MTAYVILDINVTDPARYEEYKTLATPTVGQYSGKYIARGGRVETSEGNVICPMLCSMAERN